MASPDLIPVVQRSYDLCALRAENHQWGSYRRFVIRDGFLSNVLQLELNPRRIILAPISCSRDFLGYLHLADGRVRVRRRSVRRLWQRLPALAEGVESGRVSSTSARASVGSWFGLARHANAFRLSRAIFSQRDMRNAGKRLLSRPPL